MSAVSTSTLSSRISGKRSCASHQSSSSRGPPELLLRAKSDFDETSSVASSGSSRSYVSSSSSSSQRSQRTPGVSSLATSCVSLRDLEQRKNHIERELAQVQQELQLRESQHAAARLPSTPAAFCNVPRKR